MLSRREYLTYVVLVFAVMAISAKNGADAGSYFDWARYFVSGDLSALAAYPKSSNGLPLVTWQYGAGLLASMPSIVLQLSTPLSVSLVSSLLGLISLGLLTYVVKDYSRRWEILAVTIAALILFTPAGYYLNSYSSEGWTVFLTLLGLTCIEIRKRGTVHSSYICAFFLGIVLYFLLLVKSTNIVVCYGLSLLFLLDSIERRGTGALRQLVTTIGALVAAPTVAVIFLGTYNFVINGDVWASPYNLGDSEFAAVSLKHLKIMEVLFSSWHGLLFYHPLFAVPMYWLLRESKVFGPDRATKEAWINFVVITSVLLQAIIQSTWFFWWMGLGTFGARGFSGVAVLVLYATIRCHASRIGRLFRSDTQLIVLAAFATFEAYLLSRGESNFVDYGSFVVDLFSRQSLRSLLFILSFGFGVFGIGKWLSIDQRKCWFIYILGLCLAPGLLQWSLKIIPVLIATGIFVAWTILKWDAGKLQVVKTWNSEGLHRFSLALVTILAFAVFGLATAYQIRMLQSLYVNVVHAFSGGALFDCTEIRASYYEYQRVSGYEKERAELLAFLTRHGCLVSRPPVGPA